MFPLPSGSYALGAGNSFVSAQERLLSTINFFHVKAACMTISERYRDITRQLERQSDVFYERLPQDETRPLCFIDQAAEELMELVEVVGEIPRNQLDSKLSPVLLKAHGDLDRARVQLEQNNYSDVAAAIWELEQLIYRLLNDL